MAAGPNQVWSWDITYVASVVKGQFYYLTQARGLKHDKAGG
jgi:transposase InsO family protein